MVLPAAALLTCLTRAQQPASTLLAKADEVLQEVSDMTGLPIKGPLKKQLINRAEVRNYLIENLHAEFTPSQLHVQEATLRAFGLVSRDFNLEKFLLTFYTEQAAGFYDPRHKTMFIADWPGEDMQQLVLAHELTHALQDQNFDLEKYLHAARGDGDATNAREAVVEGHATTAMMQHLVGPVDLGSLPSLEPMMAQITHQRLEEFPVFSSAPYFFRFQALFPYAQGMGFMQRGLALGGWKKLRELFARPPTTTKEIFEPRVYFENVPLPKVSLPLPGPLPSAAGLRLLDQNILGELGYYSLLGQLISEEEAKTVATGWLADRYILWERPGTDLTALMARTRWASPETALGFFRDYHTILARKYPELAPDRRSGTDLFVGSIPRLSLGTVSESRTAGSGAVILWRKGDEVRWAEGFPASQADALLSYLGSL